VTLLRGSGYSATPIADEYRSVTKVMMRCERHVRDFDRTLYPAAAVEKARDLWLFRMESEHRSASVFAGLCCQLMEAGATVDMEGIVLRMAQDELRHAEACAEVVTALSDARAPAVREVAAPVAPLAVHVGCSPEERALRNVIYGCCLSETVNSARFVSDIDAMSDPLLRDVTRQLLSDEALHAQFGFHYLREWSSWLDAHPDVRPSITRYLRYAFAVLERDLSGRDMADHKLDSAELALGLSDPRRTREVFYTTMEGAVLPSLEQFGIEAQRAWAARSFEPPGA
jgi:hypothetical protein